MRITAIFSVKRGIIVMAALLVWWATAPAKVRPMKPKKVTVTQANNGETVRLCPGDKLVVRLPAQLGTGYGWHIVKINRDQLKPLGEPRTETPPGQKPGGREVQVFRFRAKIRGVVTLQLNYARAWEKDKAPAKTFRLEVHIC